MNGYLWAQLDEFAAVQVQLLAMFTFEFKQLLLVDAVGVVSVVVVHYVIRFGQAYLLVLNKLNKRSTLDRLIWCAGPPLLHCI